MTEIHDPERWWLVAPKGTAPSPTSRVEQIDLMKAIAIVFVVLEHSMRSPLFVGDPTKWESFVGKASSACTPVFLFASGFLGHQALSSASYDHGDSRSVWYQSRHVRSTIARTLSRLLIPYVISAWVILLYTSVSTGTIPTSAWLHSSLLQIVFFDVLGLHYYVCLAVSCTLLLPVVVWACADSRVAFPVVLALLIIRVLSGRFFKEYGVSLWWQLRLPTFGFAFFTLGYVTRAHLYERVLAAPTFTRLFIGVVLVACCMPCLADVPNLYQNHSSQMSSISMIWCHEVGTVVGVCAFPLFLTFFAPRAFCTHPITRYLSETTYTIYLYHMIAIQDYSTDLNAAANPFDHTEAWELINKGPPLVGRDVKRFLLGLGSSSGLALLAVSVLGNDLAMRFFGVRLPFDHCGHHRCGHRRDKHAPGEIIS